MKSRSLEPTLLRQMGKTIGEHQLIAPGDRVMVALSGGKDSYGLLHLLRRYLERSNQKVELMAVHLDQQQPGYDGAPLRRWLEESGARFEILSEDTYSVVIEHTGGGTREDGSARKTQTYCSVCSRLRRGILYEAAARLGCNKVALGHHREDTLETFLMNLFHAGKLQAMPAIYTTDDGKLQVIRPLIGCAEKDLAELAVEHAFPILPCNLCGSQEGLQREKMSQLLATLEESHPNLRSVMLHALSNVRPTHLLDRDLLQAWEGRPASIQPKVESAPTRRHARALPIWSSEQLEAEQKQQS